MKITPMSVDDLGDAWQVWSEVTKDDGSITTMGHKFPKDTLEWRAAEYGIDPADVDTLLDIVLAEPFLTPEDWQGHRLHDAPDIKSAREFHIARCAKVKLRHRLSTRDKSASGKLEVSPLEIVKRQSHMDPEIIKIKAEMVELQRGTFAKLSAPDTKSRHEDFKKQLKLAKHETVIEEGADNGNTDDQASP